MALRTVLLFACVAAVAADGYPTREPLFASAPQEENRRELKPQAEMGTFMPLMMYMGRRRKSRGGGGVYDPKQCAATCAAQQGFCPEVSGRRLMQAQPAAPVVPHAPSPALGPQGYNVGVCCRPPRLPARPFPRARAACSRPSR